MGSMDYNYFPTFQSYQYMDGYNGDMLQHGDPLGPTPNIDPMNTRAFNIPNFDGFGFPSSDHASVMTPLLGTSTSPPAQHLSTIHTGSIDRGISLGEEEQERAGRRSSSEEKDSIATPAQTRRKAQNRAAQRAFRERKERHVRELEEKLNLLTTTTSSLQSDNERLKLMLQRAQIENEILRATASSSPTTQHPPGFVDDPSLLPASSKRNASSSRAQRPSKEQRASSPSHIRRGTSPRTKNSKLLSASESWDLLQSHPLYLSGAVDVGEVCERLKKSARCDGMGPMFAEDEVRRVIEEVGSSGGDELI